ncbi:hypothetical protein [Archangium sp.]|jgi:hypothetical protein|uniref:hypothetical protein n=1 Tax=Archangium sp. TaxID=1872627 RepID=UPI002EDA1395
MPASVRETGWIGGRRFDGFFFFGSSLIAGALGLATLAWPVLLLPLWAAWLLLLDGPHLLATFGRTYLDTRERKEQARLLVGSLLLFVPGLVAWGVLRLTGERAAFDLFLGFATLWSFHHAVRQNYGLLSLYESFAKASPRERRLDTGFLYVSLWASFGLFLLGHPENRRILGLPAELPALGRLALVGGGVALTLLSLAWLVFAAVRIRQGRGARPALFLLCAACGSAVIPFFVVGPFEPLVQGPQTPEHMFMAAAMVGGVMHGLQYLGIVVAANRRRFTRYEERSFAAMLGRAPVAAYGLMVAVSGLYLLLNSARGASPVGSIFPEASTSGQLFLVFYWGLFFHHYYLDQRIWRVRQQPSLRYELGLEEAA